MAPTNLINLPTPFNLLIHTVNIRRFDPSHDSEGGLVRDYSVASSGVKCRIQIRSGNTVERNEHEQTKYDGTIYFPPGTDVLPGDLVEHSSGSFRVISTINFDQAEVLLQVLVERFVQ